jgi:hypothetical protein
MASVIDASKRPSKVLVARELRRVLVAMETAQYTAKLTTFDDMNNASGLTGMDGDALWSHLDSSPDAAVVIKKSDGNVAVWNTSDMSGFNYGDLPLEDPNDAETVASRDPGELMNAIF